MKEGLRLKKILEIPQTAVVVIIIAVGKSLPPSRYLEILVSVNLFQIDELAKINIYEKRITNSVKFLEFEIT